MEQHPVPQNVTTFQFRLIGDMTIKQFGFLAGGAILAYVAYKLPLPFFFTWPLAFIFALGGFGFAFVPIEERPMDIWVLSFLKNIYSPTQFIWAVEKSQPTAPVSTPASQKQNAPATASMTRAPVSPAIQVEGASQPITRPKSDVLQHIFSPPPTGAAHITTARVQTPHGPFDWFLALFAPKRPPQVKPVTAPVHAAAIPTPPITGVHMDLTPPPAVTAAPRPAPITAEVEKKQEELKMKVLELQKALEEKTQTNARILELQKQLMEVLAERDQMQHELVVLRGAASSPNPVRPTPPGQTMPKDVPIKPQQPTVRIITPEGAIRAGLPRLTTFPNVVTGVIRDSDNNLLPGVLVTVRDKDGVPLRALKTNRLGQFAASTPIANGTYFVEIEDPRGRFIFDRVQITLNGSVVPGLEIMAKSHKQVSREKLAKEIFGA